MFAPADSYVPQCAPRLEAGRSPRVVWAVAAGVSLGLLGLIIAAPLLAARGYVGLSQTIYGAFGKLCHQLPQRSLHLEGHKLGVCSRCTGLYAGFALSVLLYPFMRSLRRVDTPRLLWLLLAAVPVALDWSLGAFGVWDNTHLSRFLTGALFSAVAALYVLPGLFDLARSLRRTSGGRDDGLGGGSGAAPRA